MARKNEAERLLKDGLYPSLIAKEMGISASTVIQYLRTQVGEGSLRLSDLFFSWSPEKREILQQAVNANYQDRNLLLVENELCPEELYLFIKLRNRRTFAGDMYEYVSETEIIIHELVSNILQREFGTDESCWWRKGIPVKIRKKCASLREEDEEPCGFPYAYTSLIDLATIILKKWALFKNNVPARYTSNRKQLESDFARLNRIRNAVMHPVKDRNWTEEDFEFVREVFGLFKEIDASK